MIAFFRKVDFKYQIIGGLLFSALLFILFYKLGHHALADWDEAIYAEVSKELANSSNTLVLTWGNELWFQKPPLYFWLQAASFKLFGISELSARLVSCLSGLLIAITLKSFTKILFKNRLIDTLGTFLIILTPFLIYYFRFATIDALSLLLTTLSLLYFYKAGDSPKNLILSALFLSLSALAKGPIIFPTLAIMLAWSAIRVYPLKTTTLNLKSASKNFIKFLLIFLVLTLPWHLYIYQKFGAQFVDQYLLYHIFGRATEAIEGHSASHLYYPRLILRNFPIILPVLLLFILDFKRYTKFKNYLFFLLFCFLLTYFAIDLVKTKLDWYALPLFPPLLIFTSLVIGTALTSNKPGRKLLTTLSILACLIVSAVLPYGAFEQESNQNEAKSCLQKYRVHLEKNHLTQAYLFGYQIGRASCRERV